MPWRPQSDETRRAKDEAVVTAAAALFVERGFAGTTMAEIAEAAGVSRALLYARYGDAVEILVCTALDLLVAPARPALNAPVAGRGPMWSDVTARLAERHRDDVALETVVRGAANSGIPRARAVMACLDLRRRDDALWMRHDPTSAEQVHLIERVLDPGAYAHLVGRCGWTHELYWRWLNGELARARRWRLP